MIVNNRVIRSRSLVVLLVLIFIFHGCNNGKYYIFNEGFVQGTTYQIIYESLAGKDYHDELKNLLNEFDQSLSTYQKGSIITRINENDPGVLVDEYFEKVFKKSKEVYFETDGAFDITVAPIVNLWGFGFSSTQEDRNSLNIDSLLQYVGFNKVELQDSRIIKEHDAIMLDVNAIAQGYSVDVVSEFLEQNGIQNYLVEIGGEIRSKGLNKKGKVWTVGIDKPIDNNFVPGQELQAIIRLNNLSLATSGNYRKFFEEDGVKYSHSINPKTGYPAKNRLLSVTVIASDCMTADAYATSFMIMGLEKSKLFLKQHTELEVYFVYSDNNGEYEVFQTKGIEMMLVEI